MEVVRWPNAYTAYVASWPLSPRGDLDLGQISVTVYDQESANGTDANGMDATGKAQVPGVPWTAASCSDGHAFTAPAGSFKANTFGVHDMHGNAWEWVQDVWHENYQGAPSDGSAWLSGGDQARRVARGGAWSNAARGLRSADRSNGLPGYRNDVTGMRIARAH